MNLICLSRSGLFPFLLLPLEIRYKIFDFVLQPIIEYNTDTNVPYINIKICGFTYTPNEFVAGDYDNFCAARASWQAEWDEEDRTPQEMTPEERRLDIISFERERRIDNWRQKQHPYRTPTYQMSWNDAFLFEPTRAYQTIQMVRQLSNVSHQIRNELGDLFWTRVHIDCDGVCGLDGLLPFLEDRPAVHAGIKSLRLPVHLINTSSMEVNIVKKGLQAISARVASK